MTKEIMEEAKRLSDELQAMFFADGLRYSHLAEYRLNLGKLVEGLYDFLGAIISNDGLMELWNEVEVDLPVEFTDDFKATWVDMWGEEETQQIIDNMYDQIALTPEMILGVRKLETE